MREPAVPIGFPLTCKLAPGGVVSTTNAAISAGFRPCPPFSQSASTKPAHASSRTTPAAMAAVRFGAGGERMAEEPRRHRRSRRGQSQALERGLYGRGGEDLGRTHLELGRRRRRR